MLLKLPRCCSREEHSLTPRQRWFYPLHHAASRNDCNAEVLLKAGADANAKDNRALRRCTICKGNASETAEVLGRYGAQFVMQGESIAAVVDSTTQAQFKSDSDQDGYCGQFIKADGDIYGSTEAC